MIEIRKGRIGYKDTVDLSSLIGRKVILRDGKKIGELSSIRLNPKTKQLEGITVSKGTISPDYYISKEYISSVSSKPIVLSITLTDEFIGKKVFEPGGLQVGKVKDVKKAGSQNSPFALVVDRGIGAADLVIPEDAIGEMGKNIMLSKYVSGV